LRIPFIPESFFLVFSILCVWMLAGCASRRPATNRSEPPAAETSPTSGDSTAGSDKGVEAERKTPPPIAASGSKREKAVAASPMVGRTEEGKASWYGIPFHGRRASNGEIYDMHKLTAAHRTLPFETVVRVTNVTNGKSTVVRITDRGPFVDNRIIDLSMAAAEEIESIGPGVVPVRLEILSAIDPTAGFFTVQVGAFRERGNAERLRERLRAEYSPIFIQPFETPDGAFYRVRVGKVPGEEAAQQFGEKLREREGFRAIVVRLDEEGAGNEH
jgi:rare lipoprotein A